MSAPTPHRVAFFVGLSENIDDDGDDEVSLLLYIHVGVGKIRENIFGQLSCKIRILGHLLGEYHVKFGHFGYFSYIYFPAKMSCFALMPMIVHSCQKKKDVVISLNSVTSILSETESPKSFE